MSSNSERKVCVVVGSRAKVSRCVADLRRAGKLEVSGRRLVLTRRFARH